MRKPYTNEQILTPELSVRLLEALKMDTMDMAYFADLFGPNQTGHRDYSQAPPETLERLSYLCHKTRYTAGGQVQLTRGLKLRLLKAVRLGRIHLQADFAELCAAHRAVKIDWSVFTKEEYDFLVETALQLTT